MIRSGLRVRASLMPAAPSWADSTSMLKGLSIAWTSRVFLGSSSMTSTLVGILFARRRSASRSYFAITWTTCCRLRGFRRKST